MVDGVNETSAQSSIYSISLSDLGTLNLDDKTEKAIRKYFAKHDLTNEDTLDLSIYDKDHSGDIDDDERKEAGLSKKVVNAFNKVFQLKKVQIANTQKKETFNKVLGEESPHTQRIKNLTQLSVEELNSRIRFLKNQITRLTNGNHSQSGVSTARNDFTNKIKDVELVKWEMEYYKHSEDNNPVKLMLELQDLETALALKKQNCYEQEMKYKIR